jgi:hypothetical protein
MTQLSDKYFAVQIPEDAEDFRIGKSGTRLFWNSTVDGQLDYESFPPGSYSFVCTSTDITEEQAAGIVEKVDSDGRGLVFINYENGMYIFSKAKSSFHSLLRSKSLGRVAIIKKV